MSGAKNFFDTNVLLYCFDQAEPAKRQAAHALVERECEAGRASISYQVKQEFANVVIRRIPDREEVHRRLQGLVFLGKGMEVVESSDRLFHRAISLWERYSLAWYDSLIISAAVEGKCRLLYSEDMQHGMEIDGLRIVNPFL